jgi:hypothetical protein
VTPYAGAAKDFVDQWREQRVVREKRFYQGVGWGADMNDFGAQGGPRGGPNPVTYPFKNWDGTVTVGRQDSGQRVYDINKDGVAHYGLYPDWVEDVRHIAGQPIVDDLGRGAEAYLQMWERADGIPTPDGGGADAERARFAGRLDRARPQGARRPAGEEDEEGPDHPAARTVRLRRPAPACAGRRGDQGDPAEDHPAPAEDRRLSLSRRRTSTAALRGGSGCRGAHECRLDHPYGG